MVTFTALIHQFKAMGEKTGWSYIAIDAEIAQQLLHQNKKSFRVRGTLDALPINGLALLPMGDGNFILPLKASLRKRLGKEAGAILLLSLENDTEFVITTPEDLQLCLQQEEPALQNFDKLTKSHQNYFINWINSAKTNETRIKRISLTVNAMIMGLNYSQMMRQEKLKRN